MGCFLDMDYNKYKICKEDNDGAWDTYLAVPLIHNPGDLDLFPPHFQKGFLYS